ncbi:MAG: Uncharacterized protein FD156_2714 [Nitrospirae bacterium]|nr:MAG: Uncharacterized protein FD156_2714 [Nitrospirota bacterium]
MKKKKEPDKKENNKKTWHAKVVLLTAFLAGGVCGFLIDRSVTGSGQEALSGDEIRPGGYEFINPLLECETAQKTVEGRDLRSLKRKIHDFIDEKEKARGISHVSVYYRDLNNGPWLGVDERAPFSPSSLLKVPLMMAVLKDAETNPQILRQRFTFADEDSNAFENIKPSKAIGRGKSYSVEELIRFTIAYSDNNAYLLLLKNFPQDKLIKVYTELGVAVPYDNKKEDFMSVKEYASFFRILFNASYLNREMSMKALKFLSAADYRNGIVAGVPSNVGVVHKFGERSLGANGEIKQLHDCGIVYYPDHPYLLCIMTRGKTFSHLEGIIKDVSQLIYNELDSLYREK